MAPRQKQQKAYTKRIEELKYDKRHLAEAFVLQGAIDKETYDEMLEATSRDLIAVEAERYDCQIEEIDLDGAVDFAQRILRQADRLWLEATLEQKQRFQSVLFPEGILYRKTKGFEPQ